MRKTRQQRDVSLDTLAAETETLTPAGATETAAKRNAE